MTVQNNDDERIDKLARKIIASSGARREKNRWHGYERAKQRVNDTTSDPQDNFSLRQAIARILGI